MRTISEDGINIQKKSGSGLKKDQKKDTPTKKAISLIVESDSD